MFPRLLITPWFTLHTFGVLLSLGFIIAFWWIKRAARKEQLDFDRISTLTLWAIAGGLLGAKALLLLRSFPEYWNDPSSLWSFGMLESAGDFYGGFLGALAAVGFYFRRHPELDVWRISDVFGPAIALGQSIGRIGCFMAGDDYGRTTSVAWAVTFTDPDAAKIGGAPLGVSLHPVQLYESIVCLLLFFFLVWLSRRKRFDGEVILSYAFLYAVARFFLEFFRGDADRGFIMNGLLSTSQFIALLVGVSSVILFVIRYLMGVRSRRTNQNLRSS